MFKFFRRKVKKSVGGDGHSPTLSTNTVGPYGATRFPVSSKTTSTVRRTSSMQGPAPDILQQDRNVTIDLKRPVERFQASSDDVSCAGVNSRCVSVGGGLTYVNPTHVNTFYMSRDERTVGPEKRRPVSVHFDGYDMASEMANSQREYGVTCTDQIVAGRTWDSQNDLSKPKENSFLSVQPNTSASSQTFSNDAANAVRGEGSPSKSRRFTKNDQPLAIPSRYQQRNYRVANVNLDSGSEPVAPPRRNRQMCRKTSEARMSADVETINERYSDLMDKKGLSQSLLQMSNLLYPTLTHEEGNKHEAGSSLLNDVLNDLSQSHNSFSSHQYNGLSSSDNTLSEADLTNETTSENINSLETISSTTFAFEPVDVESFLALSMSSPTSSLEQIQYLENDISSRPHGYISPLSMSSPTSSLEQIQYLENDIFSRPHGYISPLSVVTITSNKPDDENVRFSKDSSQLDLRSSADEDHEKLELIQRNSASATLDDSRLSTVGKAPTKPTKPCLPSSMMVSAALSGRKYMDEVPQTSGVNRLVFTSKSQCMEKSFTSTSLEELRRRPEALKWISGQTPDLVPTTYQIADNNQTSSYELCQTTKNEDKLG